MAKCGKEGHSLNEVMTVAGYQCKKCDYYIHASHVSSCSLGMRLCPRCKAEGEKYVDANFHGTCRIKYNCHNCKYEWIELM